MIRAQNFGESSAWCEAQQFEMSPPSRPLKDFPSECRFAAKSLYETHGEPFLALSGGADSLVMAMSFHEAKLPHKLITMRFFDEGSLLNASDVGSAEGYGKLTNRELLFVDIDVRTFCESSFVEQFVPKLKITSFATLTLAHLVHIVQGPLIFGAGDPGLYYCTVTQQWNFIEYDYTQEWTAAFHHFRKTGSAGFFSHTPELFHSYFQTLEYRSLVSEHPGYAKNSDLAKLSMYKRYFDLKFPEEKLTGFEKFDAELWAHLARKFALSSWGVDRTYNYNMGYVCPADFFFNRVSTSL